MRIPFATQSYVSRSLPLSAQRLVNLYPEIQPPDAKAKLALFNCPGLKPFATPGFGPIRGTVRSGNIAYVVSGDRFYRVSNGGVSTLIYTGITGTGPVYMVDNGSQVMIVANPNAWVYSVGGSVAQVTDPDYPGAATLDYLDGYGIFNQPGTGRFWITNLNNFSSVDALDFATAERAPDNIVRVIVDHNEAWLLGETTTEIWLNTGAADFPFERQSSAAIERGCAAAASACRMDNTIFWLGDDLVVYRANGYTPQRVSTHAIERAIADAPTVSRAIGFAYQFEGHSFYHLTFPASGSYTGQTFIYDAASGLWHERQTGMTQARWRGQWPLQCYGYNLIGDENGGNLFILDPETYTDAGEPMRREAVSPPIHGDGKRVFMSSLQVEIESGVGLTTGQGSDPKMGLSWSDDGGRTWSSEHWRSMGSIGAYRKRVIWRKLGQFRERMFKLFATDPVKTVIIAADAEVGTGTS